MPPLIDLLSPDVRADPFPTYARMREHSPVCQIEPGGFWTLSRHDDVARALKDFRVFSSAGVREKLQPPWLEYNPAAHSMLGMDPPEHTRLRTLVKRAFSASALAGVEARIHSLVEQFATALPGSGEADFVSSFAIPLPASVICHFLDMDPSRHATFKRWADDIIEILPVPRGNEQQSSVHITIREMTEYFTGVIDARRKSPGSDIVSSLLLAKAEGNSLTQEEIICFLSLLLVAGFESTVYLLGKSMIMLGDRPDLLALLRADPGLVPGFIDEMLRYDPPIHGLFRQATQDVDIDGTIIPAGSFVVALVASANRDPARFPDPDTFDMDRGSMGGLAFGAGPHTCIGSALARLEARIALIALVSRFSALERVNQEIDWHHTLTVRGPASLPMRFTAA
jgi:cytochrome P450